MYRDLDVGGSVEKDGAHTLDIKNVSPSPVRYLILYKATTPDRYTVEDLEVDASASVQLGKGVASTGAGSRASS